jgi:hypothetical protein
MTTTTTTTTPLIDELVLHARQFIACTNAHAVSLSYEQWANVRFSYDICLGWTVSRFSNPAMSLSVMEEVAFKLMAEANACANRHDQYESDMLELERND